MRKAMIGQDSHDGDLPTPKSQFAQVGDDGCQVYQCPSLLHLVIIHHSNNQGF